MLCQRRHFDKPLTVSFIISKHRSISLDLFYKKTNTNLVQFSFSLLFKSLCSMTLFVPYMLKSMTVQCLCPNEILLIPCGFVSVHFISRGGCWVFNYVFVTNLEPFFNKSVSLWKNYCYSQTHVFFSIKDVIILSR